MGNASSADAGVVFLDITKMAAKNAVRYLEKYKASLGSRGAFSSTPPNHKTPPFSGFNEEESSRRFKIPPLFRNADHISARANDTIGRVERFIDEIVLPKCVTHDI